MVWCWNSRGQRWLTEMAIGNLHINIFCNNNIFRGGSQQHLQEDADCALQVREDSAGRRDVPSSQSTGEPQQDDERFHGRNAERRAGACTGDGCGTPRHGWRRPRLESGFCFAGRKQEVKRQSAQLEISFGDSTIFSFPEVISERSLGKFAASLREFIIHDANENLLKPLVANLCVRLMKEARFAADKNDEQLADMKSQDHFTFSNDGRRECHIFDFAFIVRRFIHDDNKGNNLWQYGRLKAEESLFSKILSGDGHRVQACRKRLEDRMTEYDKSR